MKKETALIWGLTFVFMTLILMILGCNTVINSGTSGSSSSVSSDSSSSVSNSSSSSSSSSSTAAASLIYNDFESTNTYTVWAWGGTSIAYITNDAVSHGGTNCLVGYEQDGTQGWNQDGFGTMAGYNTGGNLTNNFDMTGGGAYNTLVIWVWAHDGTGYDDAAFGLGVYGVANTGGQLIEATSKITNAESLNVANSSFTNKVKDANWVRFVLPFYGTAGITNLCRDQGGNVPDMTHISSIQLAFYWPKMYIIDDIYLTNM